MNPLWYVGYGIAGVVIAFDAYLEFSGKKSLSEYVWDAPIPNWIWYVGALVGLNLVFWLVSPVTAAMCLGFWLVGHFSQ